MTIDKLTPGILSHWRSTLDLPMSSMAALLGVPLPTYIKWEKGDRTPPTIATNTIVLLHWLEQSHPSVFDQIRRARLKLSQADEKGGNDG